MALRLPPFSIAGRATAVAAVMALLAACGASPRAQGPGAADPARGASGISYNGVSPGDDGSDDPGVPLLASPSGDYLAARYAEQNLNPDRAARLYDRALKHSPDNVALLRQTLQQMIAAGRIEDAARLAPRLRREAPDSVMADLVLAAADIRAGRLAEADHRLTAVPEHGLGSYLIPITLAWVKAGEGETKAALKVLAPLADHRGLEPFHDYHAAMILDAGGDAAGARVYFDKLAKIGYAGFLRMAQVAGNFYARSGDTEKARKTYAQFLSRQPESAVISAAMSRLQAKHPAPAPVASAADGVSEAMFDFATLLHQEDVDDMALMLDRMALYLRPHFAFARVLLGDLFNDGDRPEEAVAAYRAVDPESPLSWTARLRAADLLDRTGKTDAALADLTAMAEQRPDNPEPLIMKGGILRTKERYDDAVEAYTRALARIKSPGAEVWSLYYARGIAYERGKDWPKAEQDFLTALKYHPDQPLVLNYLGYSWVERGSHLDRALHMISTAVKLRPNDGYIVDSLGWAHYRLGKFTKAVANLERAVELSPLDATINDHLGDAYWRVGRRHEARIQWNRALSLDPDPGEAAELKAKLADGLKAIPDVDSGKRNASGARLDRAERSGG